MKFQFPNRLLPELGALLACSLLASAAPGLAAAASAPLVAVPAASYAPAAAARKSSVAAAPAMSSSKALRVVFVLKFDKAALDQLTAEQTDPASPNYRKWLTPAEFSARFGASDAAIKAVTDWATANGLSDATAASDRLSVSATTTVAGAQKAFSIELGTYLRADDGKVIFAPTSAPMLPAEIAGRVAMIGGLTNAPRLVPNIQKAPLAATSPEAVPASLTPSSIAALYDLSPVQSTANEGSGASIGIYEPARYSSNDVTRFKTGYALTNSPVPEEKWPSSIARTTDTTAGDVAEADLDVEVASSVAQKAQVVLYEGVQNTDDQFYAQFEQIAQDDLPVVSFSYDIEETGADGYAQDPAFFDTIENYLEQMASQGMAVFGAAGDDGPYTSTSNSTVGVGLPATSAYTTAVGGTQVESVNADGTWNGESYWDDSVGQGGFGNSIVYSKPSWQTGTGVTNSHSDGYRQIPDVSAVAGAPYYEVYVGGKFTEYGGTSAAAPLWAASSLLISQALGATLGNFAPTLYQLAANATDYASAFHDISAGSYTFPGPDSSQVYSCNVSWDYPTGLGSVDFSKLYDVLDSSATTSTPTTTNESRFDFNKDSHADLVWYNTASGGISVWDMDDAAVLSYGAAFTSVPPSSGWQPVATPDVNDDGYPDLLWWNSETGAMSFWTLQNTTVTSYGGTFATIGDTDWKPVAAADVTGTTWELVFQNKATGAISVWQMNGETVTSYGGTIASDGAGSGWQVVGAPDLNGDGDSDLLLWNSSTGEVSWWECDLKNSQVLAYNGDFAQVGDTSWHLVGSEDTNGDGHPDLIWWNAASGAESRWLMSGTTVTQYGGSATQVQDTTWQPTAIR